MLRREWRGLEYEHRLTLPASYAPDAAVPLLFYLHGWGGDSSECGANCDEAAPAHGFAALALTGVGPTPSWNGSGTVGSPGPRGATCQADPPAPDFCYEDCAVAGGCRDGCWWTTCADTTALIVDMIDFLEQQLCVNASMLWASGCSNGGIVLASLARDPRLAPRLAGIASFIGLPHRGFNDPPASPMSYFGIFGTRDTTVPPLCNTEWPDVSLDTSYLPEGGWYYHTSRAVSDTFAAAQGCAGPRSDAAGRWGIDTQKWPDLNCSYIPGCEAGVDVVECLADTAHVCDRAKQWEPMLTFAAAHPKPASVTGVSAGAGAAAPGPPKPFRPSGGGAAPAGPFLPPGSSSAAGVFNMVLVYTDSRSVNGSEFFLEIDDWVGLIVQCEAPLFDAVLFTGYMWEGSSCFWPGQCRRFLNASDWRNILALWLGDRGVRGLDAATLAAFGPGQRTKVAVAIPYPDERAQAFGSLDGAHALNFSLAADRVAAACWWVRAVSAAMAPLQSVELVAFYWYLEGSVSPLGTDDLGILPLVAACVHAEEGGAKFMWIPDYEDGVVMDQAREWRAAGFDFATLQPNYAFYNVDAQRFANTSAAMAAFGLGVELELPLVVRNEDIGCNSTTSFYAYLDHAAELGWYVPAGASGPGALKTWYNGNDFVLYARLAATNDTLARRLDAIRAVVNGDYVPGGEPRPNYALPCPRRKN